jgi:hypothetical protein
MNKHEIFKENIIQTKDTVYENTFKKYIDKVNYEEDTNEKVNEKVETYCEESEYFGSLEYLYDDEGKCNFIIDLLINRKDHLGLYNILRLKEGYKFLPPEVVYYHARMLCKSKVNKNELKKIMAQEKKINKTAEKGNPLQSTKKDGNFILRF